MKYSLRSLVVNACLAIPFLVFGAFLVWCGRESLDFYEESRALNAIDWDQLKAENQLTLMDRKLPSSSAPAPKPPKQ